MKRIIVCVLVIISTLSYSEGQAKKRVGLLSEKQMESLKEKMSNLFSKEDNLDQMITKLKKGELGYKAISTEENEDYLKMKFVVNDKVLHYVIYKNKKSYEKDLNIFLKDDFFTHLKEEPFDKNYKLIMLDPVISSPTYGKWYAIVGQNQIIKASGDDFDSAKTNIDEFYDRLKKLGGK